MGGGVEETKELILAGVAENGPGYEKTLAEKYRLNPEDPSNEIFRATVATMVRGDERSFVRQMLIRAMGKEGGLDQAEYLSLLLDSTEKPNFKCPSRVRVDYGGKEHAFDSDDGVREAAAEAIMGIISRGENLKGAALVNGEIGKALVRSAIMDNSGKVRAIAAEILWNHSEKTAVLMLMRELIDAEKSGNLHVYANAEDAVNMAVDSFAKARVRGTALGPLIDASLEDGNAGKVASDVIARLAKMEGEVVIWLKKKRASIANANDLGDDERSGKVRRLTALINRIGLVCAKDEIAPPKSLVGRGVDDTKKAKNLRAKWEDEEPIRLPAGPVTEFFRRIGDRIKGRPVQKAK